MAFQIFWKIKFKSLRAGTDYTVNIYKDGTLPSGYPLTLKGGAQPFVTEEDDSEDMFTPIRTQSGYLRIVDDGKATNANGDEVVWNWKELLPSTDTNRPVTLTHQVGSSPTVDWQGFMQAQNFGGTLYGNPQEREFPIQCALTILEGTDINYQQTQIQNFAFLLKSIVNSIPSISRPQYFVIQGGTTAQDILLKRIDWQNFVDEDTDGALIARFNMYQALEDMCRFWGWTARTKERTLYLTCADDSSLTTFLNLTTANLTTMANGSAAGTTTDTFASVTLSGDIFASTNQDDYLNRGPKKSLVTDNPNTQGNNLIDIFDSRAENTMKLLGWNTSTFYSNTTQFTNDLLSITRAGFTATAREGYGAFAISAEYHGLAGADKGNQYNAIRIKKSYASNKAPYISIVTNYEHTFKGGFFRILGTSMRGQDQYNDYDYHDKIFFAGMSLMVLKLGIGHTRATAKWWDGEQWVDNETTFLGTIGNYKEEIFTFKYITYPTVYSERSIIDSGNLSGYLFFEMFGTDDDRMSDIDGEKMFELKDFSLQFIKTSTVSKIQYPNSNWNDITFLDLPNRFEYKAANQNNVRDEWNADCIYASEVLMEPAFGVVLNADDSYMTGITYPSGLTPVQPEQHLATRVASFWAAAKRRLSTELRSNAVADITPKHKVTIDGTTGYPIAISKNWRDDVLNLTLMEL